jgi:hypothetical protein
MGSNLCLYRERVHVTDHRAGADNPIFVVGPSRSGTELLRSGLDGHPDIFIAGETHYFDDLRLRLAGKGVGQFVGDEERVCQDSFLALSHRPYAQGGDAAHARIDRQELADLARQVAPGGDGYFEAFCRMSRAQDTNASPHRGRWGEKTPRHAFRLPEILTRYTNAQAICLVRDPRAVVASYRDWHHHRFDMDYAEPGHAQALEAEARRTAASYNLTVATLLWKAAVNAGERARKRFGDDRVRMVKYEDLVLYPRQSFAELAEWLDIEFVDSMLDVPMLNSSYNTFDRHGGVSTTPMERWREKLSRKEIAIVDFWAGPALTQAGYEPAAPAMSPSAVARLAPALLASVGRAAWANRHRMGNKPGQYISRRASLLLTERSRTP